MLPTVRAHRIRYDYDNINTAVCNTCTRRPDTVASTVRCVCVHVVCLSLNAPVNLNIFRDDEFHLITSTIWGQRRWHRLLVPALVLPPPVQEFLPRLPSHKTRNNEPLLGAQPPSPRARVCLLYIMWNSPAHRKTNTRLKIFDNPL